MRVIELRTTNMDSSFKNVSTRDKLLFTIEDVNTIVKELLERTLAPKGEKLSTSAQTDMITLLMEKNKSLKTLLTVANEQQTIEASMRELSVEVTKHDEQIQSLQKYLKEADVLLSTALFQAKQKLEQILNAQTHQVSSEDIIRFAHRISSTNAVAAPATWAPGDPRRPYPTDIDMRMGLLARLNDMPLAQVLDSISSNANGRVNEPGSYGYTQPWYSTTSEMQPISSIFASSNIPEPVRSGGNHDDVEVMSTDSSSSSSSDSQ